MVENYLAKYEGRWETIISQTIEKEKFPEIRRLTDQIGVPVMDNGRKRKALIEPRTTTE